MPLMLRFDLICSSSLLFRIGPSRIDTNTKNLETNEIDK